MWARYHSRLKRIGGGDGRYGASSFTLIELLVLVSILLPALTAGRDQSRMVLCAARLSQIHKGCVGYGDDYQGRQPPRVVSPVPSGEPVYNERWNWRLVGLRYLPGDRVLRSPPGGWDYDSGFLYCPVGSVAVDGFPPFSSSYGRNRHLEESGGSIRLERVNNPSQKLFVGDSVGGRSGFTLGNSYGQVWEWGQDGAVGEWGGSVNGCHSGVRANFTFVDGHVGSYASFEKPSWFLTGYWKECPEDWDPDY